MTEAEAKTKWCPMVRIGIHANQNHSIVGNLFVPIEDASSVRLHKASRCIASACMMWRPKYAAAGSPGRCGLAVEE